MKRFSVIDYFIPFIVYRCIRKKVQVLHSADKFLDNDPLLLVQNYNWKSLDESERRETRVLSVDLLGIKPLLNILISTRKTLDAI